MRHAEKVARCTVARTVESGSYFTLEVDYVTASGIRKTLVLPHSVGESLRAALEDEIAAMPAERRKRSFFASLKRHH